MGDGDEGMDVLLHRQGPGPGLVVVGLVLVWVVGLVLGVNLGLSVIEVEGGHSRPLRWGLGGAEGW